jgi:hypothetical protein
LHDVRLLRAADAAGYFGRRTDGLRPPQRISIASAVV